MILPKKCSQTFRIFKTIDYQRVTQPTQKGCFLSKSFTHFYLRAIRLPTAPAGRVTQAGQTATKKHGATQGAGRKKGRKKAEKWLKYDKPMAVQRKILTFANCAENT